MPATGLSSRNLHARDSLNLTSTSKTIITKNCICSRDRCQQIILRLSRLMAKVASHGKALWMTTRLARAMCSTTRTTNQVCLKHTGKSERILALAFARMEKMQTSWAMIDQIVSALSQVREISSFASIRRTLAKQLQFQILSWSVRSNTKTKTLTWLKNSFFSPPEPPCLPSS